MRWHTDALRSAGAVSVLALGIGRAEESALLQRLAALLGLPSSSFSLTEDSDQCHLLVAHADSAMLRIASKIASARPPLAFLIIDAKGALRDGRDANAIAFDDAQLRQLLATLRGPVAVPDAPIIETPLAALPLAGQLRDMLASANSHAVLVQDDAQRLLIDFNRRLALPVGMEGDAVLADLSRNFARLSLQPLEPAAFQALLPHVHALPVTPLLWSIGQRIEGPDALLPPLTAHSVLSLRQWPDFRALAHRHDHFRLCCLLLKRASTSPEAAEMLQLDRNIVDGFFNAAYLSGYAGIVEVRATTPAAAAPPKPTGNKPGGSALARMWRSVRQSLQAVGG